MKARLEGVRNLGKRRVVKAAAIGVFAVAFAARLAWVLRVDNPFDNLYSDMGWYIARATLLATGTTSDFPRELAFYPPGTHCIYAAEMAIIGFGRHLPFLIAHCLWGAAVAPSVLLLSLRVVR